MTPREDNDEQAFGQIIVRFTFDEFSKRLSLYEYVYVGFGDERLQYNLTFSTGPLCVYRRGEGWVEDRYIRFSTIPVPTVSITSCILDFYVFDNFDLLTQLKFGAILSKTYKDMTLYSHVYPNVHGNLLQKNASIQEWPLYKRL